MSSEMQQNTYTIGTVAALLKLSPDTIRHYEKCGLITPAKRENGYRSYTDDDLINLLFILYFRKMDISLSHITDFLKELRTSDQIEEILEARIQEEETNILKHRQNITRIRLTMEQNRKLLEYQQGFSLQRFPKAYIISEKGTAQELLFEWFRHAQNTPGLDMAYLYDEYACSSPDGTPVYTRSRLLLYQETAAVIPESFDLSACPRTPDQLCVCYSCSGNDTHRPSAKLISQMKEWAVQEGYQPAGTCFTTILSGAQDNKLKSRDLELYLPVSAT